LSSAILYLAIIAIWACVLVPRWIHKPHRVPDADELPGLKYVSTSGQADSGASRGSSASGNAPPAAWAAASAAVASAATASADADAGKTAAEAPRYGTRDDGAGQPVTVEEGVAWHRVTRSYHSEHQAAQRPQPQEAPGRARVLQARRRLLTALVTLAVVALACAAVNLAPWWILVPPVGMLGGYVLLLREAAQADADQERWLAQERAAQAEAARSRARQAQEVGQPEPTAEIIDISARVTDELYDQYADAAVRAVGD
jgi:hypothetical protein